MILISTVILAIIIQMTHPDYNFVKWSIIESNMVFVLLTCIGHAFIEEFIFRHLFWKNVPKNSPDVPLLIFLNVSIFWIVHLALLYYSVYTENERKVKLYTSTSYNICLLFLTIALNVIYLDPNAKFPLIRCITFHAIILLIWSIFLGGSDQDMMKTYDISSLSSLGGKLYTASLS